MKKTMVLVIDGCMPDYLTREIPLIAINPERNECDYVYSKDIAAYLMTGEQKIFL